MNMCRYTRTAVVFTVPPTLHAVCFYIDRLILKWNLSYIISGKRHHLPTRLRCISFFIILKALDLKIRFF